MSIKLGHRYAAIRRLGQGGQGSVWLATDTLAPGRRVAVKLLPGEAQEAGPAPAALLREFSLLSRLRHPGLATVHDLGFTSDGKPYLVTEYVAGEQLARWRVGRPLEALLAAAAGLLGVLDFLHRRGVVHRDVKPDNVLVLPALVAPGEGSAEAETPTPTVKLVDLGLAAPSGAAAELSGTPGYIAPEVLAGAAPTAASDLYAVGVLLHAALWGRTPFEGSLAEVTRAQLEQDVVLPAHGPKDHALRRVVEQLLARVPDRRPASAAETLALLDGAGAAARHLVGQGLPAPALVGRAAVLERVEVLLDGVGSAEAPAGLLLTGSAGAGKSRLCDEVACLAGLRGFMVKRGVSSLVPLAVAPRRGRGSSVEASAADPAAEGAAAVRRAVDTAMELAGRRPLLLIVDELPAGGVALRVVQALARLRHAGLLICAAQQTGQQAPSEPLLEQIELAALEEQETAALVDSMLPGGWCSKELTEQIHRQAGGNPLLAAELTRLAAEVQLRAEGPVTSLLPALAEREVVDRISELALLRVRGLDTEEAALAAFVSLFEGGLSLTLLQRLEAAGRAPQTVARLLQCGVLVERDGARLAMAARSTGAALLRQLTKEQRLHLTDLALELLEGAGSQLERALVIVNGGAVAGRAAVVLDGAREARAGHQLDTSARLLEALVSTDEALPEAARRRALVQELADLRLATGQHEQAVALLQREVDAEPEAAQRDGLLCALADAQLKSGAAAQGLETLDRVSAPEAVRWLRAKLLLFAGRIDLAQEVASELKGEQTVPAAEALHTLGLCRYYKGEPRRALAALKLGLDLARQLEQPLMEVRITNSLALVHQRLAEHEQARDCYRRCLEVARELGHLPFQASFLMNLGALAELQGGLGRALERYEESLDTARRFGGARETAQVLLNLGRLRATLGQQAPARAEIRRALELARALGWESLEGHALIVSAELVQGRGDDSDGGAEEALARAEAIFERLGQERGAAEVQLVRARVALRAGRPEAARVTAQSLDLGGDAALDLQRELVWGEAALQLGELDQARTRLQRALELAAAAGGLRASAEAHLRLAELEGDSASDADAADAAEGHLAQARAILERQLEELPPGPLREAYSRSPLAAAILRPKEEALELEQEKEPSEAQAATAGPSNSKGPQAATASVAVDARLLAALLEINEELNAETRSLRRLLERIIDHAVDLTGAERGFLLLTPSAEGERGAGAWSGSELQIEVARNIDQETIQRKAFKISRSVAEEVISSGRSLITINAMEDVRFSDFLSVHNLRLRSILCVPMTIRRRVRGAIYLDNRFQDQLFGAPQQELLAALADQAALAVGNWELMEADRRRQEELAQSQQELERLNHRLQDAVDQQSLKLDELARLARSQQGELEGRYRFENLVGQSAVMRELFALMDRVKDSEAPVFILGESGTGKELVAKALHYNGPRREEPFVSVNCGAMAPTLLEGELFGHEKGAFTGAVRQHRGLFERADGGSLLLDEVGDMPGELQVKLLRVLQEKRFEPLGAERERSSDFRLLAASNKDLQQLVKQGVFREDLYYRINVIQLKLPPLRQRREDVPLLVEHLLRRHGDATELEVSRAALHRMIDFGWPGNVRQLENELLRAVALCAGHCIGLEDLSPEVAGKGSGVDPLLPASPAARRGNLKEAIYELEHQMALAALRAAKGNVTEAARTLGMSRVGLHKLMKRHQISREDVS
jgi:transcriptional regulator with GAF, ATPase, and Fis domain